MRSQLDVRLGNQEPVIHHQPPDVHSLAAADDAIELADAYGICDGNPLAESQKITLRGALAERADGSWAATRIGDFGPRQGTGKNDKIAARELAGLILFKEPLIIHTAHEFPTANEAFLRLVALFENYDDLRSKVARVLYGNGTQSINLLTGQRILYKARTGGAARGFTKAALVVYDEAQHLLPAHLGASAPAKLANPNAQSWFAGSGGLPESSKAWEMRRDAILGTGGRLAYTEATAETIDVVAGEIVTTSPDPMDLDAWYRAMPGLGRWVTEESMRALLDELGPAQFAREGLCVWDPEPDRGERIIPAELWSGCGRDDAAPAGRVVYAVDVSPDGASGSIAASDGTRVLLTDSNPGTSWIVASLLELTGAHPGQVYLDPRGPASLLLPDLAAAGIVPEQVSAAEHAQACGGLLAAVISGNLVHERQPVLDLAVTGATRRPYGDAWAWNRRTAAVDISPLVAVTLARWAALTATTPQVHMAWA
jgi:hypothetical protein